MKFKRGRVWLKCSNSTHRIADPFQRLAACASTMGGWAVEAECETCGNRYWITAFHATEFNTVIVIPQQVWREAARVYA